MAGNQLRLAADAQPQQDEVAEGRIELPTNPEYFRGCSLFANI
jgi:hypothetical protein